MNPYSFRWGWWLIGNFGYQRRWVVERQPGPFWWVPRRIA